MSSGAPPPPRRTGAPADRSASRPSPSDREAPSFMAMIGVVAAVVAAVIVVFFLIGYVLGRIFL